MIVLLIASYDDKPYLAQFSRLLQGHNIKVAYNAQSAADLQLMCERSGADAVVCSNVEVLKAVLESQPDYNEPDTRKGITLNDYAGSLLTLPPLKNIKEREFLVTQPLHHIVSVKYGEFLFRRYLSKLTSKEKWFPQTNFEWHVLDVTKPDECQELLEKFATADLIADDIETGRGDPNRGITVCGFCAYFREGHRSISVVIPFNSSEAWAWSKKFGELPVRKVFQGGLYDTVYKARWNCLPSHWYWDTLVLFHSWYSELPKSLDFIGAFAVRKIRYWKDDGKSGNLHDYYRYNALDTWATVNVCLALVSEMPAWALENYRQNFPMVFPCLTCALEGFAVDMELLEKVRAEKEEEIKKQLASLQYIVGNEKFNPGSWQQVLQLFAVLGIKGITSTGAAEMLKARATSPFNDLVLGRVVDYKQNAKLNSTYLVPEKFWNNRLLYRLDPTGTVTNRMASSESSFWCGLQIQNMPRDDTVKQCLLADEGWLLAEIDKSQAEARCVGYLAGETALIDLVEGPHDYHSYNASKFFGVDYAKIYDDAAHKTKDKELRDLSKRTNHGANYNMLAGMLLATMGPKNVARAKSLLKLPLHWRLIRVTEYLLSQYDKRYPLVRGRYYQHIVGRILRTKTLVSPLGWTRFFFGRPDKNKADLNQAVAHEPQNLSVSIINREMFVIWHDSIYGRLQGKLRLKAQIHDSIVFQYRGIDPDIIRKEYMQTAVEVTDPVGVTRTMLIPSDIGCGKTRWSELK